MNRVTVSRLLTRLAAEAGLPRVTGREPIRVWRLSGVERLRLASASTVVFKYARRPFTGEDRVLVHVAAQGVPVPRVRAAAVLDGMLGMILADASDLLGHLAALDHMAPARATGADRPPFGPCHGELHHSALHISHAGWHLLDFAMAFTGPGLLDLAAWSGLRRPADPPRTRGLIEQYARSGGHRDALADRGDLPAERWALGWHRVQAAAWLLACAASGVDGPATDPRHLQVLRRQVTSARELLAA